MGYLNRVIQLDFPELAGRENDAPDGRPIIWLTIRNPKLLSGEEMMAGRENTRVDADGRPIIDDDARMATYEAFAKLIIGGNVLDPRVDSDDPPALPMPPTGGDVARYPLGILNRLGEVLSGAVPR